MEESSRLIPIKIMIPTEIFLYFFLKIAYSYLFLELGTEQSDKSGSCHTFSAFQDVRFCVISETLIAEWFGSVVFKLFLTMAHFFEPKFATAPLT